MLQCGKLKANKKANSETISREEPKGMRYMEENNKQPGLDPEAKTEKLEATPADKGQAGATEKLPATEIPADKPKVAKMETAERRIEKSLSKQGVEHGEGDIHDALIPLYERYELTGATPTLEAFAEACRNQAAGQHVKEMLKDPFRPTGKRNALIAVGCAAAAALIIAGSAFAYSSTHQPEPKQESESAAAEVKQVEDPTIHAKVNCDGWNQDTSTPIVLSIYQGDVKDTLTSTDENVTAPDPMAEKQVVAGEDTEITEITEKGTYTLAIVGSPMLDDGTLFNLPEPQVVEYDGEHGASIEMTLTPKAAENVTEADIAAAQATAVAAGADAGKASNAANAANSKASSAQGGNVATGNSTAASKNNSNKTGVTAPSQGNQGGNTGSNQGGSAQSHQHNWVAKTLHHDAVYENQTTYVHHDAVTKDVMVCNDCGAEGIDRAHLKQETMNGGSGGYHVIKKTITAAYDEPVTKSVLVSAAYDETVGYYCSTCGATK
jgi:hypothetical protein